MKFVETIDRAPCSECWTNECRFWEQCGGKNRKKTETKVKRTLDQKFLKQYIKKLEERSGRKFDV